MAKRESPKRRRTPPPYEVTAGIARSHAKILALEDKLAAAATSVFVKAGRVAARRFVENVTSLTAAAPTPASAMLAVYPTPEQAAELARPNGEPAEILHVTLAFLGEIDPDQAARAVAVAQEVAAARGPLEGVVGGTGTFDAAPPTDAQEPLYPSLALPDVPGLAELRQAVCEALAAAGIWYAGCPEDIESARAEAHAGRTGGTPDRERDARGGMPYLASDPLEEVRGGEGRRQADRGASNRMDALSRATRPSVDPPHLREAALPKRQPHAAEGKVGAREDSCPATRDVLSSRDAVRFSEQQGMGEMPGLRKGGSSPLAAAAEKRIARTHGFLPHLTLAYEPRPTLPPSSVHGLPLTFDCLVVARGDVRTDVPLGEATPYLASPHLTGPDHAQPERGDSTILAAGPPGWAIPHADEIVDVPAIVAALHTKMDPIRRSAIDEYGAPLKGIVDWDVTNPLAAGVLAGSGQHVTNIAETTQLNVMRTIRESYEQGLSIPDTSKAIREGMAAASPARGRLIARTELAAVANGGALASAQAYSDATGEPLFKRWMTAPGAEYPRHELVEGLDGQTVALDGLFDVSGEALAFPGDPNGSIENIANCRCDLAFVGSPDEQIGAPSQEPLTVTDFTGTDMEEAMGEVFEPENAGYRDQEAIDHINVALGEKIEPGTATDPSTAVRVIRDAQGIRAAIAYFAPTDTPSLADAVWATSLGSTVPGGGTLLIRDAAEAAARLGRSRVVLLAEPDAVPFYEKLGFESVMREAGLQRMEVKGDAFDALLRPPPLPVEPAPVAARVVPWTNEQIRTASTDDLWNELARYGKLDNVARADVHAAEEDRFAAELWSRGETDLPPGTVRFDDIAGEGQLHTPASDGHNTMDELARAAISHGQTQMTVTDHSHHLGRADVISQHAEIDRLNEQYAGRFRILKGIEANIREDGTLDVPDLKEMDVVLAALHGGTLNATERFLKAMDNPYVTALAHPHAVEGLDWDAIAQKAARNDIALEVNGRELLRGGSGDEAAKMIAAAKKAGARFQIGADVHRTGNLVDSRYAVRFAAQHGVKADDVAGYQRRVARGAVPFDDNISVPGGNFVPPSIAADVNRLGLNVFPPEKGAVASKILGAGKVDTLDLHQTSNGRFTEERQQLHKAIFAKAFKGKVPPPPGAPRHALYTAGGGASGKSGSVFVIDGKEVTLADLRARPDFVVLDADVTRAQLPEFQRMEKAGDVYAAMGTHGEASMLTHAMEREAVARGFNVVYDSTGSGGKFVSALKEAEASGYHVQVSMFSISTNEAIVRNMARGIEGDPVTGVHRYVSVPLLKDAHRGASANLQLWKDRVGDWRLYDNSGFGEPFLVAERRGGSTTVYDEKKFAAILAKQNEPQLALESKGVKPDGRPTVELPDGRTVVDDVSAPGQQPVKPETLQKAIDYRVKTDANIPRGPVAQRLFGDFRDSEQMLRNKDGRYPAAREAIYDKKIAATLREHSPAPEQPEILLTAGGGASGKSLGLRANPELKPADAVEVNPDITMTWAPEWKPLWDANEPAAASLLHEEGSYLSKRLLQKAIEGRYNVIFDVVGDEEPGKFAAAIRQIREMAPGYKIKLLMADSPTNVAIDRNIARASDPAHVDYGRFVPIDVQKFQHRAAIERIGDWWEMPEIDEWEIYRTKTVPGTLVAKGGAGEAPRIVDTAEWMEMMEKVVEETPGAKPPKFGIRAIANHPERGA